MNTELLKTNINLENERIQLVPLENERNSELRNIIFDDEIWEFMGMYIRNENDFNVYIKNTLTQKKAGHCCPFLVIDKLNNIKKIGKTIGQ